MEQGLEGKELAVGMSRVSDRAQEEGASLETQEAAILEESEKLGYYIPSEYLLREVWTGAVLERPVLTKIRTMAQAGAMRAFFVYSPDRLSRDPLDTLILMREFNKCGVMLHLVKGEHSDSPEGQLLAYVQGYGFQQERVQFAERSLRGKRAAAERGRMPNGTGSGLFGYDYDKDKKVRVINESEAVAVELIFRWASEGVSIYGIACRLNELGILTKKGCQWPSVTVKRVLENPAFTGVQPYGANRYVKVGGSKRIVTPRAPEEVVMLDGFTPPLVTKELFDRVQECLKVRQSKHSRGAHNRYLLTGFVKCIECGRAVVGGALMKTRRYYRCRGVAPIIAGESAPCKTRFMLAEPMEEVVWRRVCDVLKHPEVAVAELRSHFETGGGDLGQVMSDLRGEVLGLKNQQRRLMELWQKDMIDMKLLEGQIAPLKSLCDEKEQELRVLEEQQKSRDDQSEMEERIIEACRKFSDKLDGMDFDAKRATLGAFCVKVSASRDELSISVVVDPKVITTERTWA